MTLSVILPVCNEEPNLILLYDRLDAVTRGVGGLWEFIFIDDGSTDDSLRCLEALHAKDPRVKVISFTRNFGHQAALTAGLDVMVGDAAILMDADLQHPPELLKSLIDQWRQGFEIVHTRRQNHHFSAKDLLSSFFYRLFRCMSGIDLGVNAADFRLLDRRVVHALRQFRERSRFIRGLTGWVGFRVGTIPYFAEARHAGQTKYSWSRMVHLAIDGLVSFSTAPLYWAIYTGFILSGLGLAEIVYALITRLITHHALPGWTSLIIWISLIGGLQLVLMGVSGMYIAKIYEEVKERPLYLIRRRWGFASESESESV